MESSNSDDEMFGSLSDITGQRRGDRSIDLVGWVVCTMREEEEVIDRIEGRRCVDVDEGGRGHPAWPGGHGDITGGK